MSATLIIIVSSVLFCYWAKRVVTLIHRPEEAPEALETDLWCWRNAFVFLRSLFSPSLANCG